MPKPPAPELPDRGPFKNERQAHAAAVAAIPPEPGWSILSQAQRDQILHDALTAAGVETSAFEDRTVWGLGNWEDYLCATVARWITAAHEAGKAAAVEGAVTEWSLSYTHRPNLSGLPVRRAALVPDDESHLRLIRTAAEYVSTRQTVGPVAVQRAVRVGFAKAARLLEDLEAAGKVSAPDASGRRRVLAPDRKAEAAAAAERAIEATMSDPEFSVERSAAGLARAAVDAAAPILADAIGRKILDHMETHGPDASGNWAARNAWRRHLNIAAQVASFAFSTDADIARAAAEAFTRGDAVVCTGPEIATEESP